MSTSSPGAADAILAIDAMGLASGADLRIGWDVVSISQYSALVSASAGQHMLTRCFTRHELDYARGRPERLAGRWAAKEAVAKAIGTGFRGISARDIEIRHHPNGQPSIEPLEAAAWPNDAHEWWWSLTITHEGDAAAALAVAVRTTPERKRDV